MKKWILVFAAAAFLIAPQIAEAQAVVQVPFATATLQWGAPIGGDPPLNYHVKCKDRTSGVNLPVATVVVPITQVAVNTVIPGPGKFECFITASNDFGESGASNTLPFDAGVAPNQPVNLGISAQ